MKTIEDYFKDKPTTKKIFNRLRRLIDSCGESEIDVKSQITFGAKRKFAWIWLYNITGKNPEGTVQIMLALDEKVDEPPVYRVTRVGAKRWNHLIVIHDINEANNEQLIELISKAYKYGAR